MRDVLRPRTVWSCRHVGGALLYFWRLLGPWCLDSLPTQALCGREGGPVPLGGSSADSASSSREYFSSFVCAYESPCYVCGCCVLLRRGMLQRATACASARPSCPSRPAGPGATPFPRVDGFIAGCVSSTLRHRGGVLSTTPSANIGGGGMPARQRLFTSASVSARMPRQRVGCGPLA